MQYTYERALMLGEVDPFDFYLAEQLHITLQQVGELPNHEYVKWRAFNVWRNAQRDLDMKVTK